MRHSALRWKEGVRTMGNNKYKILIVEDEANIRSFIKANLETSDYQVLCAETCALGIMMYASHRPDLIVLDLGLPDRDGLDLIQKVRESDTVPIIVLSARSNERDKVEALDLGANDYITKPFSLAVLRARVNAQLRRSAPVKPDRIELNGFIFDFAQLEFSKDGTIIDLSKTEQRLLRLLVENRGRTLPRELLLEKVWDGGEFVDENALSVAVRRLRIKLGDAPIKTVYGVGYTWEAGK